MPVGVAGGFAVAADGDEAEHGSNGVGDDRGLGVHGPEAVLRPARSRVGGRGCGLLHPAKGGDDGSGRLPEPGVVVRVGVALNGVGHERGFHRLTACDGHLDPEEVGGRDERVHPVGVRAPRAVVALLEQSAAVRAYVVAVVKDAQAGLAHRGRDADLLVAGAETELLRREHDVRGVDELLVVIAGDRAFGHARRVNRQRGSGGAAGRL